MQSLFLVAWLHAQCIVALFLTPFYYYCCYYYDYIFEVICVTSNIWTKFIPHARDMFSALNSVAVKKRFAVTL